MKNLKLTLLGCMILLACVAALGLPALASTGSTTLTGTVPLVIYNVQDSGITGSAAIISWRTNGNATSQVFYDTESHEGVTEYKYYSPEDTTPVLQHSVGLNGLSPSTTYHYRAKSAALIGGIEFVAVSPDYTFNTLPAYIPPGVITIGALPLGSTSALLWGILYNKGSASSVEVYFQWGETDGYGFETAHQILTSAPNIILALAAPLTPNTTYHFRAVAVGDGTSYGDDKSFTTPKFDTTTRVTSSANPSVRGQSVTFTATVTGSGGIPTTGTVTFKDGGKVLGTKALDGSGQATYTTTSLSVGTHSITAVYGGDSNFNGSTSPALSQKVNKANTSTTVISSLNPSVRGQSVTFTATVKATAPGAGTPTGTVTFKDGGKVLGTKALDGSGQATYTTTSLSVGTHSINAVYGGDSNFNGSTSPTLTQVVNRR